MMIRLLFCESINYNSNELVAQIFGARKEVRFRRAEPTLLVLPYLGRQLLILLDILRI